MADNATAHQQILKYLKKHSAAGNTLEEIARWWLMRHQVRESVDAVREALTQLKAKKLIVERVGVDGRVLYFSHTGVRAEGDSDNL